MFRQQNITPFCHGVMYKFCHPRYNLSVVTSHHKYEFFTIIESTKIWKFVSNFSKEIEALDFKHLASCQNGHNLTHGSHWTHKTLQTVPAVPTTFVVDLFVILVMHCMWYDICFSDLLVMFKTHQIKSHKASRKRCEPTETHVNVLIRNVPISIIKHTSFKA